MNGAPTLADKLVARIAADGPITVADYMAVALGDPAFGYYKTREPFGRQGDFITAPEISQMFGELIGLWVAQVWLSMGQPPGLCLAELGPGRGTLMADILRTLARAVPALHETVAVHLVETSAPLRKQQAKALEAKTSTPAQWHERIDTLPDAPTIVVANEFIDALPIHQYVKSTHGWHERLVGQGISGGALGFCLADEPEPDTACLQRRIDPRTPVETIAEIRPEADALMATLAERLRPRGGAALFIDYGYTARELGDTFQAVRKHQPQHVLLTPGEADLTAHVDFAALASAATAHGLVAPDVITQASFLKTLGIETRAARLKETASPEQARDIDAALERLVSEDRMGALFKALTVHTPGLEQPPGFTPAPGTA